MQSRKVLMSFVRTGSTGRCWIHITLSNQGRCWHHLLHFRKMLTLFVTVICPEGGWCRCCKKWHRKMLMSLLQTSGTWFCCCQASHTEHRHTKKCNFWWWWWIMCSMISEHLRRKIVEGMFYSAPIVPSDNSLVLVVFPVKLLQEYSLFFTTKKFSSQKILF